MRDVYDHINTVVEDMDTLNEDAKGLIDLIFDKVTSEDDRCSDWRGALTVQACSGRAVGVWV